MGGRIGARMDGLNGNDAGRPRNVSEEDDPQIEDDEAPADGRQANDHNKVSREPEREPEKDQNKPDGQG